MPRGEGRLRMLTAVAALAVGPLAGCVPGLGPCVLGAAQGRVRDADTGEPIPDAEVIEWYHGAGRMGGPQPEVHARWARTDAEGRFAFERALAPSPRLWLLKTYGPSHGFYHPSYGLVLGARTGPEGELRLAGSLRDSALRLDDLAPYCSGEREGAGARRLAEAACPLTAHASWPDGTPRAVGEVDAQGRRTGLWTFHYQQGGVAARGRYRAGAPVGPWQFYDRHGDPVASPPTS